MFSEVQPIHACMHADHLYVTYFFLILFHFHAMIIIVIIGTLSTASPTAVIVPIHSPKNRAKFKSDHCYA